MLSLVRCGLLLIGLCSAVTGALAQSQAGRTQDGPRSTPALDELRAGLRARPAEERARLERRLDEFEKLPPQARRKLLERARALRERERSVGESLPRELRARLEGPDAERAREQWDAHLRERFRERGRELRARLPENLRRRLEHAPPEARRRFLERLFQEREPVSRKALDGLRARGLSGRELRRLERLPVDERLHALLEIRGGGAAGSEREGG